MKTSDDPGFLRKETSHSFVSIAMSAWSAYFWQERPPDSRPSRRSQRLFPTVSEMVRNLGIADSEGNAMNRTICYDLLTQKKTPHFTRPIANFDCVTRQKKQLAANMSILVLII
jgi:hypothetical protein